MPIRKLDEINAGSMADIAFLLLIFFIVTTTMSLESGILQVLPVKSENTESVQFNDRNVFSIVINNDNDILIETEPHDISELGELLYHFLTANMFSPEKDVKQVMYTKKDIYEVENQLREAREALKENPNSIRAQSTVSKLEKAKLVCEVMPGQSFLQITELHAIQIKQKANTSYGIYIKVKTEIGKVINQLRDEWSRSLFNGLSYFDLDRSDKRDHKKIKIIEALVPGQIMEPEIVN